MRMIVGCVPVYGDQVLLCRRAIEPRRGLWTLPAGFMENGESTAEGAARETWEEARGRVSDLHLYRVYDLPSINQVYMFYLCDLDDGAYGIGPESTEVAPSGARSGGEEISPALDGASDPTAWG